MQTSKLVQGDPTAEKMNTSEVFFDGWLSNEGAWPKGLFPAAV